MTRQTPQPPSEDADALRRCMREMLALSALPAVWSRSDASRVAEGLSGVLCRSLSLDLVYVRLRDEGGTTVFETACRNRQRVGEAEAREIGRGLESVKDRRGIGIAAAGVESWGPEGLQLAIVPIGCEGDCGVLVAGTRRRNFPEETERLLLEIAVNNAAVVLLRLQAEASLRESEQQFRRSIEEAPIPVIMHAEDGEVLQVSRTWTELTGYTIEDRAMIESCLIRAYEVGGGSIRTAVEQLFQSGQALRDVEFEVVTRDGERRVWAFSASSPGKLRDGRRFIVGMAEDITVRKRHEAQMRIVMAELSHRVKNTLAVIRSIASQTIRRSPDLEAFTHSFQQRLDAIAKAHSLLTRTEWEGAALDDIITSEVAARVASKSQCSLSGPVVRLRPKLVLAMHMVIHELTTNAVKYGALKSEEGHIDVRWSILEEPERRLEFEWSERSPGFVGAPADTGYGSRLIDQLIEYELQGDIERTYTGDGLRCRIRISLEAVVSTLPTAPMVSGHGVLPRPRVLVVEEHLPLATSLCGELEECGVSVIGPVATIPQAMELAVSEPIAAAILDVDLDGANVYRLARHLRGRGAPFALVTGDRRSDLPEDLRDAVVLTRPVRTDVLQEFLRRYC